MIHWRYHHTARAVILLAILLGALTGCAPHQELRSPCHVAGAPMHSDCEFTPLNRALT